MGWRGRKAGETFGRPSPGATRYTIQVSRNSNFSSLVFSKNATFSTYVPPSNLLAGEGQRSGRSERVAHRFQFHHTVTNSLIAEYIQAAVQLPPECLSKLFCIFQRPAAFFNAAALSVRSQGNSISSRPKWP